MSVTCAQRLASIGKQLKVGMGVALAIALGSPHVASAQPSWEFISGTGDNLDESGVYEDTGSGVHPGGRSAAGMWTDADGNIWMFGGQYEDFTNIYYLNDMWKFDTASNAWELVPYTGFSGPAATDQASYEDSAGVYSADALAYPASRQAMMTWSDDDGNLWMFGGSRIAGNHWAFYNDLWRYDISENRWYLVPREGSYLSTDYENQAGIHSNDNLAWPTSREEAVTWKRNDELWLFGGMGEANQLLRRLNDLWKYDLTTGDWTLMVHDNNTDLSHYDHQLGEFSAAATARPGARHHSTGWTDASGDLWLFGGLHRGGGVIDYVNDLWRYDVSDNVWVLVPRNGSYSFDDYASSTGDYTTPGSLWPGWHLSAASWQDNDGNFWLFGGRGDSPYTASQFTSVMNDLWMFDPDTLQWSLMNDTPGYTPGDNGDKPGVYTPPNPWPGSRDLAGYTTDNEGNFWMFGGWGYAESDYWGDLNDLWKFGSSNNNPQPGGDWIWKDGSHLSGVTGTYPAPGNVGYPGARDSSVQWTDENGDFWLFGGFGLTSVVNGFGDLNDLWKYDTSTETWIFVWGSDGVDAPGDYPNGGPGTTVGGGPGSRRDAMGWAGTDNTLWLFGGYGPGVGSNPRGSYNDLWQYDIDNGTWTWVSGSNTLDSPGNYNGPVYNPSSRSGGSTWVDSEGDLWLFGGTGPNGLWNDVWRFDVSDKVWEFVSGNPLGNVFTDVITGPNQHPGSAHGASSWKDTDGNLWLFGGHRGAAPPADRLNTVWKYDPLAREWTYVAAASGTTPNGDYSAGAGNPGGFPGARSFATAQATANNVAWLFGGEGHASTGGGFLGDLWALDMNTETWTYVGGPNLANQSGDYPANYDETGQPGTRTEPASWLDQAGDLWIFGGRGNAESTNGYLNDLWVYDLPNPPDSTYLVNGTYVSANSLSITFNQPMGNSTSVLDPTNYRISGPGAGTRVDGVQGPTGPVGPIGPQNLVVPGASQRGARWADHTPTPANPATVMHLSGNTYVLTWTQGAFTPGQALWVHVDGDHLLDGFGNPVVAPLSIMLMIPLEPETCVCPVP